MTQLAIVIPAYKSKFFSEALKSLANQTNKNFNVYIGDDNSPENLKRIADNFCDKLNIHYTKFENNIGAKNLVKQWERCVNLTENEKWLWLFSDDDIMDYDCVQTFFNTVKADNEKFDVYRFNTRVIDDEGHIIAEAKESPFIDDSYNMAISILRNERGNSMPDHIFSRAIYNKKGGFVETSFAQSADWATSILFSQDKGICSMKGAKVNWRLGNNNISGSAYLNKFNKQIGYFQFLNWLLNHFAYLKNDSHKWDTLMKAMYINYVHLICSHYKGLSGKNFFKSYSFLRKINKSILLAIYDSIKLILN